MKVHPPASALLLEAVDNGWSASLVHGVDTGGSPYVHVEARREQAPYRVIVTWHTRETGTYRLFSAMVGQGRGTHDVSLAKAHEALTTKEEK